MFNINSNLEGCHAGNDQMSHLHHGGSYYGSPNGEVTWVNEPDVNLNQWNYEGTYLWETVPPSGQTPVLLCDDPGLWNWWATK
jgi:Tfp pilus assembly protein PilP